MMKISIAMATYNGAKYLQEQLDSFVAQTRQPDELVVCDDVSTDTTVDILENFRQKAPFTVRIYRNEMNLGYTKNFEKSILNCSGDLIFFSDQDDVWYSIKIDVVEKVFLANTDKHLVIHDGKLADENLVSHGVTKLGQVIAGYGTYDAFATGALTAIRREFLPYILPIPKGIIGHDGWIHLIARLLNTRLVLDQSLQVIRRHSMNTSSWVASSIKEINKIDVWKKQCKTPLAKGYEDRILINESSQVKLECALNQDNTFSHDTIKNGLIYLKSELSALRSRNSLVKANVLKRKITAVKILFNGQYRYFNGVRSFLRDFLR